MSTEANKAITRRLIEEGFNQGRVAIADELIAAEFVDHAGPPGLPNTGPESVKQLIALFRAAFPDIHASIADVIAEGDRVVVRAVWRGTHRGELLGIPPTGKAFTMTGIDILRLVDGKVVEHWGNEDDLGMMQQLGVIPELVQAG